jgi:peptide-methionine (R)-S-oxide reductase
MSRKVEKTDAEWKAALTPEQYAITRRQGTERAFTGAYWDCHDDGAYHCACCGALLFASDDKYDSGSGWPSFVRPAEPANVETDEDRSHSMVRVEVRCKGCGAHLGHVFEDGPPDRGGMRYCINSASLALEKKGG